jgi:hypothetical protein
VSRVVDDPIDLLNPRPHIRVGVRGAAVQHSLTWGARLQPVVPLYGQRDAEMHATDVLNRARCIALHVCACLCRRRQARWALLADDHPLALAQPVVWKGLLGVASGSRKLPDQLVKQARLELGSEAPDQTALLLQGVGAPALDQVFELLLLLRSGSERLSSVDARSGTPACARQCRLAAAAHRTLGVHGGQEPGFQLGSVHDRDVARRGQDTICRGQDPSEFWAPPRGCSIASGHGRRAP